MPMALHEDKECEKTNHARNKTGVFGSEYQLTNMSEESAAIWKKLSENEEQSKHFWMISRCGHGAKELCQSFDYNTCQNLLQYGQLCSLSGICSHVSLSLIE